MQRNALDADMITGAITFVVSNYVLSFFVISLIVSAIAIARAPGPVSAAIAIDKLLT
jgi:hypothetical protein